MVGVCHIICDVWERWEMGGNVWEMVGNGGKLMGKRGKCVKLGEIG